MDKQKFDQFDAMFDPSSFVVVGASIDKINPGAVFLKALLDSSFQGEVYPVNPAGSEIFGVRCYPTVNAIPGQVDYVLVSVPASAILETLDDCAAKGVKVAQIFTAGFRELGTAGYHLEEEMVKIAHKGKFRIFGPNCLGIYNPLEKHTVRLEAPDEHGWRLDEFGKHSILFETDDSGQVTALKLDSTSRAKRK